MFSALQLCIKVILECSELNSETHCHILSIVTILYQMGVYYHTLFFVCLKLTSEIVPITRKAEGVADLC